MTKRLLAIALVVMVAVSAMYLPSVLSVSAADTTKTADKAGYEALLKTYTVTVNGYNRQTVKIHPSDVTSPEAMLKALAASSIYLPANSGIVAVEPIAGETDAYNVKTATKGTVKITAEAPGFTSKEIKKVENVIEGSAVADLTKDLANPPVVLNKIFLRWDTVGVDTNYDGKVDNVNGSIVPVYGNVTGATTLNFYEATTSAASGGADYAAQKAALKNGAYATVANDGTVTTATSVKATTNVYNTGDITALYAVNATTPTNTDTAITVANVSLIVGTDSINQPAATLVFSHWVEVKGALNVRNFVAVYKDKAAEATYTYNFVKEDGSNFATNIEVKSNTLTSAAFDLLNADQKKVITDYLGTDKAIKEWTITNAGTVFTLKLVPYTLKDTTYYYVDENGMVNRMIKKVNTAIESPLDVAAPATKGYTFTKWNKVANEDSYNGLYNVGEVVILPEAKNGNDSFAFSSTATPKKATYKKTMVARVTAGKGTFSKAEVKLVNKTVKLSANAINCTVKKGTMKETSGTPYTITFNKKGTAYVVVSIAYNGNVYTKTLTKTVK